MLILNKYFDYLERKEMNINVTNKALNEIKKVLKEKKSTSKKIRIFLAGIGWGGPTFNLALDEQKENDEIY